MRCGVGDGFADHKPSPGPQDAGELTQRRNPLGHLAQASDKVGGIEAAIGEGQPATVAERGANGPKAFRARPRHGLVEQALADVEQLERSARLKRTRPTTEYWP